MPTKGCTSLLELRVYGSDVSYYHGVREKKCIAHVADARGSKLAAYICLNRNVAGNPQPTARSTAEFYSSSWTRTVLECSMFTRH